MNLRNGLRQLARAARRFRKLRAGRKTKRMRPLLLLFALIGLALVFASSMRSLEPRPSGAKVRLDELDALAQNRLIADATFRDEDAIIQGTWPCSPTSPLPPAPAIGLQPAVIAPLPASLAALCPKPLPYAAGINVTLADARVDRTHPAPRTFWMPYPKSDLATGALIKMATESGAHVSVDQQTPKANLRMVTTFVLPLVMLATLFALLFTAGKGSSAGIGDVIVFGSFRKRRVRRGRAARVTFGDVAGADHAVAELAEIVDYLRSPERYRAIGAQSPKGVLMIGPPGCGKTLLAKACAGEADVPFFSVAGAEFVESLVGVGAARVRDLFRRVRAAAPAIVFIDELDAAGRRRGSAGGSGGSDEREQTLNQLLVEMDGFDAQSGIVVIGATNRPDILDPALLRPGRFDRQVTVDQPGREGRRDILDLHARERKIQPGVDFEVLARRTPGFSGAELANVVNEAALLAIRASKTEVGMEELLEGIERVQSGPQKRSHVLTAIERTRIAAHEAGHAIAAAAFGRLEEVHRVTILRRGRSLGATVAPADGESGLSTRSGLQRQLATLLAGAVAEELILGEPSTAAEGDIEQATILARDIAARYGMSERLGRPRLLATAAEAFLEDRIPVGDLSPATQRELDLQVRELFADAERAARRLLEDNRRHLDVFVKRLESEETVEGSAVRELLLPVVSPADDKPRRRKRAAATVVLP